LDWQRFADEEESSAQCVPGGTDARASTPGVGPSTAQEKRMKRCLLVLSLMLTSFVGLGCGGGRTGSAATMPDGSRIAILVFTDRGITPDMPPDKVTQLEQLSLWMERDLMDILNKTGYAASQVTTPARPPGPAATCCASRSPTTTRAARLRA
jgi:hypothetical protein